MKYLCEMRKKKGFPMNGHLWGFKADGFLRCRYCATVKDPGTNRWKKAFFCSTSLPVPDHINCRCAVAIIDDPCSPEVK